MKKINIFILVLALSLSFFKTTHAASSCSYSEQVEFNDLAANVKTSYEPIDIVDGKAIDIDGTGEEVDLIVRGLKLSILNITNDIYIKLINNKTEQESTYYYNNTTDGVINIQTKDVLTPVNYTVEVYANKYSCVGELYRKFDFQTPAYNPYSELQICQENPGFYYCQEFISNNNIDLNTFYKDLENYKVEEEIKEEKSKTFWEKIKEFYNNNALTIYIIAGVIIIAGVTTTVILVKKRRSRVL